MSFASSRHNLPHAEWTILVEDEAGDEVGEDRPAEPERQCERSETDPEDIDPGVVGDPCADTHQLGIVLVAVKRGAGAVHARVPFFSAISASSSRSRIWPWPTRMLASGTSLARSAATFSISLTSLCTK